jgi:hypothetical protein
MLRRLEDRIRELCRTTLEAPDDELEPTMLELKAALREHTERLRKMAALKLVGTHEGIPEERRSYPAAGD